MDLTKSTRYSRSHAPGLFRLNSRRIIASLALCSLLSLSIESLKMLEAEGSDWFLDAESLFLIMSCKKLIRSSAAVALTLLASSAYCLSLVKPLVMSLYCIGDVAFELIPQL